ncbi:MAG: DUF695 domain-containing protein [Reichenbachiella sp.]
MNKLYLLALLLIGFTSKAQSQQEDWQNYIATYDQNKPGSVTLRMDLINSAPLSEYEYVLVTGVNFETINEDGFPDSDQTFSILHKLEDEVLNLVSESANSLLVGSFMYNSQRLQYFYLSDTVDIRNQLNSYYNTKSKKGYINIKEDQEWNYYREFLYPNQETLNYMGDESVVRNLMEAGDDLSTSRRVDHWIYFKDKSSMKMFEQEVSKDKFIVESSEKNEKTELPFELNIWRIDKVDLGSIYPITNKLRLLANKMNAEYDGWETVVVKK